MDIDKLILEQFLNVFLICFGSLMDIDKLIHKFNEQLKAAGFGSLMDIDKLIPVRAVEQSGLVLVL